MYITAVDQHKMAIGKVFKQFYAQLIKALPMDDPCFIGELFSSNLLPGNLMDQIKAEKTPVDKAVCFLDGNIKRDVSIGNCKSFYKLLKLIEDSEYEGMKSLAEKIRNAIKEESVAIIDNNVGKYS